MLCDAQGVHDIPTAEWVVAAILAMQKYLPFYFSLQQAEDWSGRRQAEQLYRQSHASPPELRSPALIDEVAETTVLIVGYGSIGKAIEARLAAFGSRFLRVARHAREGVAAGYAARRASFAGRHRGADYSVDRGDPASDGRRAESPG